MKVNILGTEYEIFKGTEKDYTELKDADGFCGFFDKKIFINDLVKDGWDECSENSIQNRERQILRHEIIHAFLYESGLYTECETDGSWAMNEQMVDWMAIQMPKIMKAYDDVLKQQLKYVDADTTAPAA